MRISGERWEKVGEAFDNVGTKVGEAFENVERKVGEGKIRI